MKSEDGQGAYKKGREDREEEMGPQLTKEEIVLAVRFLTEPERLNLHGHESRGHCKLVDKLMAMARHAGVPILGEGA